jgi:hypothetical protein
LPAEPLVRQVPPTIAYSLVVLNITCPETPLFARVLILQPTNSFKLLAQWAGPYPVTRKLNTFNYEIDLGHRKTVLHINLLRKWEERVETVNVITVHNDETDRNGLKRTETDRNGMKRMAQKRKETDDKETENCSDALSPKLTIIRSR